MTEWLTPVDLYVLADSQEEADELTLSIVEDVFTRSEVVAVNAELPSVEVAEQ